MANNAKSMAVELFLTRMMIILTVSTQLLTQPSRIVQFVLKDNSVLCMKFLIQQNLTTILIV